MYSFSYLEPVCCSMSSSNCCFLTCMQISQEAGQVVWYSHLFQNFPQFIVIHPVKAFGIVNQTEIDVFLELSFFFHDPADVGNLISGSSAFSKTSLNIRKFTALVLLKPGLENFKDYFTSIWDECNCATVWAFFGIAFLWDWNENWPFPVLWPGNCLVFQICWHIECNTFTASSFRIWNRSTGIPSPPLDLFVVMLYKAHLTSYSRMSGSRWVTTPSWLSWSWRSFLYSSSVYSGHFFLISSAFVRSIPFLSFIEPIFAWNIPLLSLIFLKRSLVFPILLFSSISLHWLLRKAFLFLAILWNSAFRCLYLSFYASLLSLLFVRPPQAVIVLFCISFPWGWSWSLSPLYLPQPPPAVYQISFPFLSLWILSRVSLWYTIGSTYIYFMQSSVCMSNSITKFISPLCLSLSIHLFFTCGSLFLLCKLIHLYHFARLHM